MTNDVAVPIMHGRYKLKYFSAKLAAVLYYYTPVGGLLPAGDLMAKAAARSKDPG